MAKLMQFLDDWAEVLVRVFGRPSTHYVLAWLLACGIATARIINAHLGFQDRLERDNPDRRIDGNRGHTTIDFGGQWMMGRLLLEGYGKQLFHRYRQWEVAQASFPRSQESPTEKNHDADNLVGWFMGLDDPRWVEVTRVAVASVSATNPWEGFAFGVTAQRELTPERLAELQTPKRSEGIGGPLYPPIHAFVMAPLAIGKDPQTSYFINQWIMLGFTFLGGAAVSYLSRGRFWCPFAVALILMYPGCRGGIDLGQNCTMTLAIILWGWALVVRNRPLCGGIVLGLLAYKPVWAISFFLALMLLRQWRAWWMMGITGAGIALSTIPVVGIETWLDWLYVGRQAADLYNVDSNWVPLSRDLLGIPRRLFLDFSLPRVERNNLLATLLSWALWLVVLEATLRVYRLRGNPQIPTTGPLPAMILATTWLCTYHFMYYDALISFVVFAVLLADPRFLFQPRALNWGHLSIPDASQARTVWLMNSFVLTILGLMIFNENSLNPLKIEITGVIGVQAGTVTQQGDTPIWKPALRLGTGDSYPWETVGILVIWCYAAWFVLAGRSPSPEGS